MLNLSRILPCHHAIEEEYQLMPLIGVPFVYNIIVGWLITPNKNSPIETLAKGVIKPNVTDNRKCTSSSSKLFLHLPVIVYKYVRCAVCY